MRMLSTQESRYARLASFVRTILAERVLDNGRVWDVFLESSKLRPKQAKEVLSNAVARPLLVVAELPYGKAGRFSRRYPQRIHVSAHVAKRYESDWRSDRARLFLEVTVLHELVHWGDYQYDGQLAPEEIALKFEKQAYGEERVGREWYEGEIPNEY